MSDRKDFADYMDGFANGYGHNLYSQMGVNARNPAPEPCRPPPEPKLPTFHYYSEPKKTVWLDLKPKSAAEEAKRRRHEKRRRAERQLERIAKRPPLLSRMKGHVRSVLDCDGKPSLNAFGEFDSGEIIPHPEHLRRLKKAYASYWHDTLQRAVNGYERWAKIEDAEERLALMEQGIYLSPVNFRGRGLTLDLFRRRRFLWRSWVARNREYRVGLVEYDRRMRLFLSGMLSGRYEKYFGVTTADGATMFETFIRRPSTEYEIPGKDRQFRLPSTAAKTRSRQYQLPFV